MEKLSDSRWREVTLLLAGIMRNATPLVSQILSHCEQTDDEPESHACLLIAFVCLYEAEVADDVRDKVLGEFADLPYEQAVDVIQNTFGSIEEMNSELEMLVANILKNPNEVVQALGLGLLERYPGIYMRRHIVEILPLKSITEACWRTLIADQQENSFDHLNKAYTLCMDDALDVKDRQKLLLAQSAQLVRFLSGREASQPASSVPPPFTCDREKLPDSIVFADDFARLWRDSLRWFIDVCCAILWSWDQEPSKELFEMRAMLARDLDRVRDLTRNWVRFRVLDLDRARGLARVLARDLARDLDRVRDLDRDLDRVRDLDRDLAVALAQAQIRVRDLALARVRARVLARAWDRKWLLDLVQFLNEVQEPERPYIALARYIALALILTNARIYMLDNTQNISFMINFLQTVGQQDREHPWYFLTISQQIEAASFIKPDSMLSEAFREHWQRAGSSDVAHYQYAFFVNLATLLHSFGIILEGTFFDEVLTQSSEPQAGFVLRVSFLLHQIITDKVTQKEKEEFEELLAKGGSEMEREWLELSGLTWLYENILAHSEAEG